MNTKQLALIKKDVRSITSNKQMLTVMMVVPLALSIIVPTIFVLVATLIPEAENQLQALLKMMAVTVQDGNQSQVLVQLLLNKIMPAFFLIIPIMASSVMAASSFVGEKEKHTLETLLYSPLSLKQLFQSKILAGFSVGMMVSFISFFAMMIVLEVETLILTGSAIMPDIISWIIVMFLIAPAISLVAIGITVRSSAKAQTVEDAQQRAAFLVFPILALIVCQFTGVIMLNAWILLVIGIVLAVIAVLLTKNSVGKFSYEKLLK